MIILEYLAKGYDKASNFYVELSKNLLNPSDEFINKIPKRYMKYREFNDFYLNVTTAIHDVNKAIEFNKTCCPNIDNYENKLYKLYDLVKNF